MNVDQLRDTNRASLDAIMTALGQGDWDAVLEYWSRDGLMEIPYGPANAPRATHGFDAIADNQRRSRDLFANWTTTDVEVHATTDPNVFFCEYRSRAEVRSSGRTYENRYVGYFRFEEGKLVHWKEFFDPQQIREAFSRSASG